MADTTTGHFRRRTADAKISPSADGQGHLSDWLSKIKQIQEETDKGDEAVRKDLQEVGLSVPCLGIGARAELGRGPQQPSLSRSLTASVSSHYP